MQLLQFTERGIYCPQADVYIDPWRPVGKAIITHGHADHSRPGNRHYICHTHSEQVIRARLGQDIQLETMGYGETFTINGVRFSLHPAGHIIGSAQVRVEYKGQVWVASGDYKTEADGVCAAFEPVKCHVFITECTFGLPVYKWPAQETVFAAINSWWAKNQADGKVTVLSGYSLGKAQRLLQGLDTSLGTIFTHGAIHNMNHVLRESGIDLNPTTLVTPEMNKSTFKGGLVLAPPSALGSNWQKQFQPFSEGIASGWMGLRGPRRRRAVDRGFVLSDHADWDGLNEAIAATGAEKIITTHGSTNVFTKWLREKGYDATAESTEFEGELSEIKEGNQKQEEQE